MANENERLEYSEVGTDEYIDFDELEKKLQTDLDEHLADLDILKENREKIGSPENLGTTVMNVAWEQFLNQMAITAGEDFIRENRGHTLDLRNDSHIQTPENFKNGKIANHNYKSAESLEQNYDRYKNTSHHEFRKTHVDPAMDKTLERAGKLNKNGTDTVRDIYTGRQISTKTKLENGKNNPKAAQREHVTPSSEIYKDPSLHMANSDSGLAETINNSNNLQGYTTAERNNRKSNNSANNMESEDLNKHWEKADKQSKEYLDEERKKGEERLKVEGKTTQKEEAFRMTGKALRAAIMQLLAELIKEIIRKLILWVKSAKKNMDSLLNSIKSAIGSFIEKLKTHCITAIDGTITAIAAAIWGPVVGAIKKIWIMLKQGWKSLEEAIAYIKNPHNKNKPFDILALEVGKIVVVGLSAAGAIVLSEVIGKGLMTIPIFALEIPLLGSLASLIGLFMSGLVAGIIGAIALNLIDKAINKKQMAEAVENEIKKGNEILNKQNAIICVNEKINEQTKNRAAEIISKRHIDAATIIRDSLGKIHYEEKNDVIVSDNQKKFDDILSSLKKLQE